MDTTHSLIFTYALRTPPPASTQQNGQTAANPQPQQTLEGLWWKQEPNVSGFVALSNLTSQPITASAETLDAENHPLGDHSVTISPHGTKIVELTELLSTSATTGGVVVSWTGNEYDLAVNSGLQDPAVGYSAHLPLATRPDPSDKPARDSYAELGLMTGPSDPMMSFPSGVVFTPYSVLRNISEEAVTATPALWWMQSGSARSAQLPQLTVAPHQTVKLDVAEFLNGAGLKNWQGNFNLVLNTNAPRGALLLASGSVDQTNNYVIEVFARGVGESASKGLHYWSTANGDDTMVTIWNPADEAQDFVFTLFYTGGHYLYPIHLEPRATHSFNVSEITRSGVPDSEGNVVPASAQSGSAELAGSAGENQMVLVTEDEGIYNVRKATCGGVTCTTCNGFTSISMIADLFAVGVGGNTQQTLSGQWNTGTNYNYTNSSTWSSSNTSVATVNSGLVTGVSPGSVTVTAILDVEIPPYAAPCVSAGGTPVCPPPAYPQQSGLGAVGPYRVEPIATNVQGNAVCPAGYSGWSRTTQNQLQYPSGSGVLSAGITMADILQITGTNQLGLTGTQTGSYQTDANGSWPDTYFVCSTACPTNGQSDGIQTWTHNSTPLPHSNLIVYQCSSITIDGF